MTQKIKKIDKFFLTIVLSLLFIGLAFFISASFSVYARNSGLFFSMLLSQIGLGFCLGFLGMFFALKIPYKWWRNYAFYFFIGAVLLTLAVFIPKLGVSHGGAKRWLDLGPITIQPAEFLKFTFVLYFASWLSWVKHKVTDFKNGFLPLMVLLFIVGAVLYFQPDTKSLILMIVTGVSMFFLSGGKMKYILAMLLVAILGLSFIVFTRPYLQKRIETFLNPSYDPRNSSYQLQQSIIAVGAGGFWGRGYGQSVQKFGYLPEAHGDSIFAVLAEETGFWGSFVVILLYTFFFLRGMKIANNSPDLFSRLLVSGIVIMITAQSFLHIASVLGVFPLTGVPLVFMSHGGTSLLIYMITIGIVLQISKYQVKNN